MPKTKKPSEEEPVRGNFQQYMHEISRPELLSKAEEVDLAKRTEDSYRSLVNVICDYDQIGKETGWGFTLLLDQLKDAYESDDNTNEQPNEANLVISRLEDVITRSYVGSEKGTKAKEWIFELLYWSGHNPDPNEEDQETAETKFTVEWYRKIIFSTIEEIKVELVKALGHYNRMLPKARSSAEESSYQEKKARTEETINTIRENINAIPRYRKKLIERNLRLVVNRAKPYVGKGLDLKDLVSAGNIGLIKAVERFDYRKGNRFSTYAVWQIKAAIGKAIGEYGKTIRLPENVLENHQKWFEAKNELLKELQRNPTDEEIAPEAIKRLPKKRRETETPENLTRKIKSSKGVAAPIITLEGQIREDSATTLKEIIEDRESPNPEECGSYLVLASEVRSFLSILTPREDKMIRMRFGIGEDRPYTLQEVGDYFGLTRARIQQIAAKALKKLKGSNGRERLKTFWD
jgi:RNA polymerase sigma factor (sigma-70 family)